MNIEISKGLLSEVLHYDVYKIHIKNNTLEYDCDFDDVLIIRNINIYELAHKIEDWIESKDFYILNTEKNIYRLFKREKEVYSIDTKTRIDVPFMCGQWILENESTS